MYQGTIEISLSDIHTLLSTICFTKNEILSQKPTLKEEKISMTKFINKLTNLKDKIENQL
jgi:hypothetical protein